jgi:hypothetical protein
MSSSAAGVPSASLSTSEGALVSVSIHIHPRYLEALLEALARIDFPINPQIYHDAEIVTAHPDGSEEIEATTVVEFPAYVGRLEEVHRGLLAYGFSRDAVHVTSMLDELRGKGPLVLEPAEPGSERVVRYAKSAHAATHGAMQHGN